MPPESIPNRPDTTSRCSVCPKRTKGTLLTFLGVGVDRTCPGPHIIQRVATREKPFFMPGVQVQWTTSEVVGGREACSKEPLVFGPDEGMRIGVTLEDGRQCIEVATDDATRQAYTLLGQIPGATDALLRRFVDPQ